jgi:protein-tyrosine-phosphatase
VKIIFACVHNAGRSQMAAAFYNRLTNSNEAISAGTSPGANVHPEVVLVMREVGIDLSHVKPQLLTKELADDARILITMGCGETCPALPGLDREDWALADPKGKDIELVRQIRDEIEKRVRFLVEKLQLA